MKGGTGQDALEGNKKKYRFFRSGVLPVRCLSCSSAQGRLCILFFSDILFCFDSPVGHYSTKADHGQPASFTDTADRRAGSVYQAAQQYGIACS